MCVISIRVSFFIVIKMGNNEDTVLLLLTATTTLEMEHSLSLSLVKWLIHPANFYNYLCIPNGSYLVHHSLHWYKIDDIPTSIDYKLLSSNPSPSYFPPSSHKLYYTLSDCSFILPIPFQSTVSSACPTNFFSSKEDKIEET